MPKDRNVWAVLAKQEATYGDGTTPATTDELFVNEEPNVQPDWIHDGSRAGDFGMMRTVQRVGRFGREFSSEFTVEPHGGAAAYDDSTVWPNVDLMLRAAGYVETVDTTPSSETVAYDPDSTNQYSASVEIYARGEKFPIKGVLVENFQLNFEGPQMPIGTFPIKGIGDVDPTDAALPNVTYPSTIPPIASSIALGLGTYTGGVIRSFSFNQNRDLERRIDDNAAGHGGLTAGMMMPVANVVLEADTLATSGPWHTASTFNPYKLIELATPLAFTMSIGTVQYNKYVLTGSDVQLANFSFEDAGPIPLWNLELHFKDSAPGEFDSHQWLFD